MVRKKRVPYRTPKKVRGSETVIEGRKPRRWKQGTVVNREIKKLQRRTDLLIPHAPFCRIVRRIAEDNREGIRFKAEALRALHEGSEAYVVELLQKAYALTTLQGQQMLQTRHLYAAMKIMS